jgi:hypothetical protein
VWSAAAIAGVGLVARTSAAHRHRGGADAWRAGPPDPANLAWLAELAAWTAELMKAARTALRDAAGTPARVTGNRVTAGRLQLRLRRDLLWYPYPRSADAWEPAGPPQPEPARATETL